MRPEEVLDKLVYLGAIALHADSCPDDGCEGGDLNEYEREVRTVLAATLPEFAKYVLHDASHTIDGLEYLRELPEDATNPEGEAALSDYLNRTDISEWLRDYANRTYL